MGAVGDERRAIESPSGAAADEGGDPVAGEAERACERERREMVDGLRVDEAGDRLVAGDAGADEDRGDDGEPGEALAARAAQGEGDAERDRGGGVTGVVDEVGEQRDGPGRDEDRSLRGGGEAQDEQCEPDRAQALP